MSDKDYLFKGFNHLEAVAKATSGLIQYSLNWDEPMTREEINYFLKEL